MARATSSLPVPVSPWMMTDTSIGAIFLMRPKICRIFTLCPTMPHSSPSRSGSTVTSSSMGAKVSVELPARICEPGERYARSMRRPSRKVPLVELRSTSR